MSVRVRFAPSPTGPLHIGGVRTALFNYLFAKKNNGKFILRIEDTDQTRYVRGAEEYIMESLSWLGIKFDEGIKEGGPFAPYKQSERSKLYHEQILKLVRSGNAYYAFDTAEELEQMRIRLQEKKASVQHYNYLTRVEMKNSYTLNEKEVEEKIKNNVPYVIRFNMPNDREVKMYDIIRGEVTVNSSTLDDKVLFKSDGLPTYHLANIVDDHFMEITHVIRGEEWLPSLPLHILLYEAFGWIPPKFAHLPLILKPNGAGKLSKRDGDQMGFPVFPTEWTDPETGEKSSGYRESGYLPEAVVNMLALLGWNPGTDKEIYNIDELSTFFELEKVQKGGAKFDPEKTKWFNQQHLKNLSVQKIQELFIPELINQNIKTENFNVLRIIDLVKDRAVFVKDFWNLTHYFFKAPVDFDDKAVKKNWKEDTLQIIREAVKIIESVNNFVSIEIENKIKEWIEKNQYGFGKVLNPLRIILVGTTTGPHLFDIIEIIGKDEFLRRIEPAIEKILKIVEK